MNRTLCSTLLVAAAALAGCNQSNADSNANEAQANADAAAPLELPPSIAASKTYRCRDNSLLYVDWYSDGTARVKASRNEAGTAVPAADVPTVLKGDAQSTSITHGGQTCHV